MAASRPPLQHGRQPPNRSIAVVRLLRGEARFFIGRKPWGSLIHGSFRMHSGTNAGTDELHTSSPTAAHSACIAPGGSADQSGILVQSKVSCRVEARLQISQCGENYTSLLATQGKPALRIRQNADLRPDASQAGPGSNLTQRESPTAGRSLSGVRISVIMHRCHRRPDL